MATIDVKEINPQTFQVTVHPQGTSPQNIAAKADYSHLNAGNTTQHEVSVDEHYAQNLTAGRISTADLVKKSFEFLLERESNHSILRRFNLTVISHYFPEYEEIIKKSSS